MKKSTALLLAALMLLCLLPGVGAQAASDYSWIKVKLSTNNATSLTIYASGTYFIKENGAEFTGGTISVRSNGDGTMTLSHSSLGDVYTASSMSIMRANIDRTAGYLKLNGYCYLGHLNLKYISSGYIRAVNEVPLAHYLYGVVGYEMSNTFPIEALKAQAIAAKCYVLSQISMSGDYYIGDTSSEQVYKGYNASYTNVIAAVDSTIDQVLAVNGRLLCTYYAASNGGETLLPSQAWPSKSVTDAGYGISADSYDLSNAYSKKETIKIPVGMSGSISSALLSMLLGKASSAAGYTVDQINGISSVALSEPKYSGTNRNMTKCTVQLTVSQSGANLTDVNIAFYTSELESYGVVRDSTLRSYWGEMTSSGYYCIYHVRYGHGVGMSQRGAQSRANAGQSYRDILGFYYPGASLATISVTQPASPVNNSAGKKPEGSYVEALTTGNVRMRSGAGTNYSSLATVPRNAVIAVYTSENGWAAAAYDGKTGYISEKYVSYPNGMPSPSASPEVSPTPAVTADAGVIAFGSVNGSMVNLRTGPSTSYDSVTKLAKGTQLNLYGATNGWYQAAAATGEKGYMISTYVSITGYPTKVSDAENEQEVTSPEVSPTPTPTPQNVITGPTVVAYGKVTGSGVNFRSGPATSYASFGRLERGTQLDLYDKTGGWYYAKADGVVGYISGGYVEVTAAATPTPAPVQTDAPTPTPIYTDSIWNEASPTATPTATPTASPTATPDMRKTVQVGKINAAGVNMRIGPGTSYTTLKKLGRDTGLYILASSGKWFNVQTGGVKGYVYETYVTVTGTEKIDESGNIASPATGTGATGKGVTTGNVRLREGTNTDTRIISTLKKGTTLTLYGIKNGWYQAKLADGTAGYVSSKYVSVTEAYANAAEIAGSEESVTAIGTGKTTCAVNFRQGPTTSSKKLTTLAEDTEVTLHSLNGGWYEAEYKGTRGYLFAKYVTASSKVGSGTSTIGTPAATSGTTQVVSNESGAVTLTKAATTAKVNFRSGPNTDAEIYDTLAKGTTLEIIGQTGTWYYAVCSGKTGFISTAYVGVTASGSVGIQAVSSSISPQSCKTNAEVNMRTGPSTSHTKLTTLADGTPLTVYYVSGEWCFVKCNGTYGFVYDEYVSVA